MPLRHPFAQAAALVIASLLIAVVANGFAGRTRQLKLPGWYPHALRVPPKEQPAPTPIAVAPMTTTTVAETTTTPASPTQQLSNPATQQPVQTQQTTTPATQQPVPTQQPSNPATQQPTTPSKPNISRFTPHPDKPYVEITGDDAAALYAAGVLFLDARRSSIFEEGHIAGARSYSVWEADVDDKVNALFEERSDPAGQNQPIVIYCSGGACEDSHMLSQKLWGLQFNNVYVYKDGFPDWQKRKLPVRTGTTP